MATHSNILAWEIPWTEEPGGLPSIGVAKRQDLAIKQQQLFRIYIYLYSNLLSILKLLHCMDFSGG